MAINVVDIRNEEQPWSSELFQHVRESRRTSPVRIPHTFMFHLRAMPRSRERAGRVISKFARALRPCRLGNIWHKLWGTQLQICPSWRALLGYQFLSVRPNSRVHPLVSFSPTGRSFGTRVRSRCHLAAVPHRVFVCTCGALRIRGKVGTRRLSRTERPF